MIDLRMQLEDAIFDIWPHETRALRVAAAIKKASPDDQELFVRWAGEIGLVKSAGGLRPQFHFLLSESEIRRHFWPAQNPISLTPSLTV